MYLSMKPNRLKTLREKINRAKRFDNLHKRPDTEDWAWHDRERNETAPKENETVSH